jgi:hypothetical protein
VPKALSYSKFTSGMKRGREGGLGCNRWVGDESAAVSVERQGKAGCRVLAEQSQRRDMRTVRHGQRAAGVGG